jgi:tubulin-specific chaperone A
MSHELRTPLNSILLLARYLFENKQKNLKEKEVEMAKNIHSSGNLLLNLINDILDLAKIESGKTELNPANLALNKLAEFVERNFSHSIKEKGLVLNVRVDKGLPGHVYTDQQRLEQIINNFISNALKFTSNGSIAFSITRPERGVNLIKSGLKIEETIAFSVSDTGEGIPQGRQGIIFEAFKQVDGSTSRQYGGTGLGLSISRDLASLMGGEIQLRSEIGKGSSFTLYLPEVLKIKESHETITEGPSGDRIAEPKPKLYSQPAAYDLKAVSMPEMTIPDDREDLSSGDKSILIIEDDEQFAEILMELGREKHFKCLIAGSGESGLKLADEYSPNAIILDIILPGMNGWIVMDNLKNNPKTRHIPVHFCSVEEHKKTAMRLGAIGYLSKPVSKEQIEDAFSYIEQHISSKIKRLLVVENDPVALKLITKLLGSRDIKIFTASTGRKAIKMLKSEYFDCVVLDLGVKNILGFDLLKFIKNEKTISDIPVIIYTERSLTEHEEEKLREYTESIVVKNAKSLDMLLDEVSLFLHRVETDLPKDKQKRIRMIYDKELVLKNKKILLVDDDMRNVFAIKCFLEEKEMNVLVATNGEECPEHLERDPEVDFVLMDIMMPKMDGLEAMRKIRKQKRFKNLPIIALTAKAMKTDRVKCIEAGANDYLAKPVDIDKLMSLLRVWLYK